MLENLRPKTYRMNCGWPWSEPETECPDRLLDGSPWPEISVVTPSYNQEQFLEESIRSVLLQCYPNLEYLIMDGGSTDGSLEIIRRYARWIDHWQSKPDNGQAAAINEGWKLSSGEIFLWLNSDDLLVPGSLFQVGRAFSKGDSPAALIGSCKQIDGNGHLLGIREPVNFQADEILRGGPIPGQPAVFLRSSLREKIGYLREDLFYLLDWEYWLRIAVHFPEKCIIIPEVLAAERLWEGRKTVFSAAASAGREKRRLITEYLPLITSDRDKEELRSEALSEAYWMQSREELIAGDLQKARFHFIKAFRLSPSVFALIRWMRYLLASWLGYPFSRKILDWFRRLDSR